MNTENMIKYVEALESGAYAQDPGGGHLKTSNGFCCLGVLEDVRGADWAVASENDDRSVVYGIDGLHIRLPHKETVTEFLGLPNGWNAPCANDPTGTIKVTLDNGYTTYVHNLNDSGTSFTEIARLIRRTYGLPPAS